MLRTFDGPNAANAPKKAPEICGMALMPYVHSSHERIYVMSLEQIQEIDMKRFNIFDQVRAAQNLKAAFEYNREFAKQDLDILGLPADISKRFKK